MNELETLIDGCSTKDALDALYFAARFVKQAEEMSRNPKDFFEDDDTSSPSDDARALALKIISAVETSFRKPCAKLSNRDKIRALRMMNSASASIETHASPDEIAAADAALLAILTPELKKTR